MSKLPEEHKFLDLSDYGRPVARMIANRLASTKTTPIQVTLYFVVSGLIAIYFILQHLFILAAIFLVIKSILDAADGELARVKNTPSYTGRYLDSVSDIILNFIILLAIWSLNDQSAFWILSAFFGIQLQGTLYNYYYVILRNRHDGDKTSRVIEEETPIALPGEKQKHVNIIFRIYKILYGPFDSIIYKLDSQAPKSRQFPSWFMTALSTFGLGFQLLLIGLMLVAGFKNYILPFFSFYSFMIFVFIAIRIYINKD